MAWLSASSRNKNTVQQEAPGQEPREENYQVTEVDACEIISSQSKGLESGAEKLNSSQVEEEPIGKEKGSGRLQLTSERCDSGISDCSSISHQTASHASKKNSIAEEEVVDKTDIDEEDPKSFNEKSSTKFPKEEIDTRVDLIRKKFANLSKNIDEMDKKLESVGKELIDIGPGEIATTTKPEIQRVPSLKEHKIGERRRSSLLTSADKKLEPSTKYSNETSTLTISSSSDSKSSQISTPKDVLKDSKNNNKSISLPTAKNKFSEAVQIYLDANKKSNQHCNSKSSANFERLQKLYNSKVAAAVNNFSEKNETDTLCNANKSADKVTAIRGIRSLNFQEAVAFWKR